MKRLLCLLNVGLLAGGALALAQQPTNDDSCKFTVRGTTAKPTISGPDDVVALVYVVEQPDSPVETVAIDFEGSRVSVHEGRFADYLQYTVKVRNRTDRPVEDVHVWVTRAVTIGGTAARLGGRSREALLPGEEEELAFRGGVTGDMASDHRRLIVYVGHLTVGNCEYLPSLRISRELGVKLPPWWPQGGHTH